MEGVGVTVIKSVNTRELVLGILIEVIQKGEYSHIAVRNVLEKYQYLDKKDRAFITRIAEGTLEQMIQIDYIINQFSSVKISKMKPVIRNILRLSVYQLKFMDHVPASAVCNEGVKLAQKKGFSNLKGFVNGVLRTISRNLDTIIYPSEEADEIQYLSIMYSMPEWILKDWYQYYDYMTIKVMLESFLTKKYTSIRCNLNKTTPGELVEILQKDGIEVKRSDYLDYGLEISGYNFLNGIPSFKEGLFQVQDVSSMLVTEIGAPKPGDYVIDICAAPGGKSLHAADKTGPTGHVEARDLTEHKVQLIRDNVKRLGISNVEVKVLDATIFDKDSEEKADVLIADLPCSGLGVIGKKTDIKYKITKDKQEELVKLQRNILDTVYPYVKKGGILIYSTCTIHKKENLENMKWFEENYPFALESMDPYLPQVLQSETTQEGYLQLLPGIHNSDGFFIARFRRKK